MASYLPPLKVELDDHLVEVFTHRSLRDENSAANRLAVLGEISLNFVITRHWYMKLPKVPAPILRTVIEGSLSDAVLQACIEGYGLRLRLICHPNLDRNSIGLDDCRDFLNTYVGALFEETSISGIQRWVSALIDPEGGVPYTLLGDGSREPTLLLNEPVPQASEQLSNNMDVSFFNRYAKRERHTVVYEAMNYGKSHCLTWSVRCFVDGRLMGIGQALRKRDAKLNAVREACKSMGLSLQQQTYPTVTASASSEDTSSSVSGNSGFGQVTDWGKEGSQSRGEITDDADMSE
ncbi:hypothetical protein APHAL10511_004163 [Amanita phalloides]|nr:hypothetical protein APHAL10511_004163 [Amanita phalloides]